MGYDEDLAIVVGRLAEFPEELLFPLHGCCWAGTQSSRSRTILLERFLSVAPRTHSFGFGRIQGNFGRLWRLRILEALWLCIDFSENFHSQAKFGHLLSCRFCGL